MLKGRVVVVTSKFAPHAGGTATVWTEWCRRWPAEEIVVIAPWEKGCLAYDRKQAHKTVRVRYPNIPKVRMPALWFLLGLRACWEAWRGKPRLIHFQHVFENASWGPIIKRLFGTPYYVHVYGEELVLALRHHWLTLWVRFVLNCASGVTTISVFSKGLIEKIGCSQTASLIHPGVDCERFTPQTPHPDSSPPILLTVGRLMERKGHDQVIQALPTLLPDHPNLTYLIAGVGPEENRLRNLTKALGLTKHVHFLGKVADDEVPKLMRESTIFVHPNRVTDSGDVEGFGIVFLEASACGIPVVGGASGGTPDAIQDGTTGFLVDPEDNALLASTLHRLLGSQELREEMGANGRQFARDFSWDKAALQVWEECRGNWDDLPTQA